MRSDSPGLAVVIAAILNGEELKPRTVQPSGLRRYGVQIDPRDSTRSAIFGVMSTVHDQSRFGNGFLATTNDEELAHQIVDAMNRLDPEQKKRGRRGVGWW